MRPGRAAAAGAGWHKFCYVKICYRMLVPPGGRPYLDIR